MEAKETPEGGSKQLQQQQEKKRKQHHGTENPGAPTALYHLALYSNSLV